MTRRYTVETLRGTRYETDALDKAWEAALEFIRSWAKELSAEYREHVPSPAAEIAELERTGRLIEDHVFATPTITPVLAELSEIIGECVLLQRDVIGDLAGHDERGWALPPAEGLIELSPERGMALWLSTAQTPLAPPSDGRALADVMRERRGRHDTVRADGR